jgi:hypothetical protein
MSTATPTTAPTPLWAGKKLPVVGVTGEFGSGKTLFLLTIDPDCFDKTRPPRTILWGTEAGLEPYVDSFAFEHRPLTDVMLRPGYKPEHLYLEWLGQMRAIQPGLFRFGGVDTISEIENGLADWAWARPEHFGYTRSQFVKMKGLYWGCVKNLWKQHLSEAAARFECFGFSSHTKLVWEGDEPTREKTAKGKQTLWELASLYLWLDRTPEPGSKKAPMKPSGTIFQGKNRLVHFDAASGELRPILPPRLPEATPDAIRHYIEHPANYNALKAGERALGDVPLTEDEKLLVNAAIARDQAAAAGAELSRVEMMRQAAQAQGTAMARPASVPTKQAAEAASALSTPAIGPTAEKPVYSASTTTPGSITQEQQQAIVRLFEALGVTVEAARTIIGKPERGGCKQLAEMSYEVAAALQAKLEAAASEAGAPF